jgi:hypothetical protein
LSGTAGVSEAQAERESAREILSDQRLAEGESKDLYLEPYA